MELSISPTPLRVLIVEDRVLDAELLTRELTKHGFAPSCERVDTEQGLIARLREPFDLIISDAIMPQFSAFRCLEILNAHHSDIPCIIVSGSIGEEEAVALIRAGAADYLMKDRLGRFGESVRNVLAQRRLREAHHQSNLALQALNEELERRIADRTAELERVNDDLSRQLTERRQIELLLRQHEASLERHVELRTAQLEQSQDKLRRLAYQLTLTEQNERKRLAADLHDYLAQLLVVTKLKLNQAQGPVSHSEIAPMLRDMESYVDQALTYTRTLVSELSPTVLFRRGLIPALRWLVDDIRPHGLITTVNCTVDRLVVGEDRAVLLYQSVRELLFNVVKHAGTHSATLTISRTDGGLLSLAVEDQGQGFDVEMETQTTGRFGLFSIQERIELMGGAFVVTSARGVGARVEIRIPCESPSKRTQPLHKPPSVQPPSQDTTTHERWSVLVVDDHTLLRNHVVELLSTMPSVEVVGEAASGQQAVELAERLKPDLILMDVNMPDIDGIEATERILAQQPSARVLGVTIQADPAILARLNEAGALGAVSKETLNSELEPAIRKALREEGGRSVERE